jgi:hypothetical protein
MHGRFAAVSTILSGIPVIEPPRWARKNYYRIPKIFLGKSLGIGGCGLSASPPNTKKAGVSPGLLMMDGRRGDSDVAELRGDRALSKVKTLTGVRLNRI